MDKKILREIRFMMDRLESPRMTETELNKKYKKLLREEEETDTKKRIPRKLKKSNKKLAQATEKLQDVLSTSGVSEFVSKFRKIASDPRVLALLRAGLTDGNTNDESVNYNKVSLSVKGLLPTQAEIGFDQSIENILTDKYNSLQSILDGEANVGGPIVTYNGKYVIDGHHRWSQVYAANPNAKMQALNIVGDLKPTKMLKIVHTAIVAKVGGVPSSNPKGINILNGITEKQVLDATNTKLSPKAKDIWASKGLKNNESIANHIYKNLINLINKNKPVEGAPGRKDMPQTDAGSSSSEDKLKLLQKGVVNFKNPKPSDISELRELIKHVIKEEHSKSNYN